MTTPTGAAILGALAESFGPMPAFRIEASGFGAGTRDIEGLANCTQAVVGTIDLAQKVDTLMVLETNIDDATGEVLGHAVALAMDAGARDAWITPILMKKGRPAHMISVLITPTQQAQITELLQAETGTLGIRSYSVSRLAASRRIDYVDLDGEPIRIKVGPHRAKPEFEDAVRAATNKNRPVREIIAQAEQLWKQSQS